MGMLDRTFDVLLGKRPPAAPPSRVNKIAALLDPSLRPTHRASAASTGVTASDRNLDLATKLAGGRATVDSLTSYSTATPIMVAPNDFESNWRTFNLDANALSMQDPMTLLQMLSDLSPEVSRALHDFLRLANPSCEITVTRTSKARTPYTKGQQAVDDFLETLKLRHGSVDVIFNRLFLGAWLRGAFACELVLDTDAKTPVDIATPDPASFRFRRYKDPVFGERYEMGQWQSTGGFVVFNTPLVRYLPIDPYPASPYGRPLCAPALFTTLFLLGLLHDLRRVVAQQGYPRIDLTVNLEKLAEIMPDGLENDPDAFKSWVEALINEIQTAYSSLQPDDAYIHTDVVTVGKPVGVVDASSLAGVQAIIELLERMAIRALKTMPIMMGINTAVSEANANRQWEIMAAGVKSMQNACATLLSTQLQIMLQAQGIQAFVCTKFGELRAAEELRDQQKFMFKLRNAEDAERLGYMDHDEASRYAVGHDSVGPAKEMPPKASSGDGSNSGGLINYAATSPESETGRMIPQTSPLPDTVINDEPRLIAFRTKGG